MNKLKRALLGAAVLLATASAAGAADVYQRGSIKDTGDAYLPPITWTGFYAGVHAGASFGGELEFVSNRDGDVQAFDVDTAFTGGLHVGYNWQASPNWVLGVEGSLSLLSDEAEDLDGDVTDYLASVRGRVGVAAGENLFYGTGGVAFLGYADETAQFLEDDVTVGFVVGAGFERKLSSNVSFGVESLYYNFEEGGAGEAADYDLEHDFWTVTARLNYHLNSGYDAPLK